MLLYLQGGMKKDSVITTIVGKCYTILESCCKKSLISKLYILDRKWL